MSVPRFDILLEENKSYQPGQTVTGHVLLDLTGLLKSRGVVLSCRGGGYVRISPNRKKLKAKQFLENREIYFTEDRFIAGNGRDVMLFQPGSYTFEFRIKLPLKIPNTIHTVHGYVRYVLYCRFYETELHDFLQNTYLEMSELQSEPKKLRSEKIAVQHFVLFKSYDISHVPGILNSRYEQAYERVRHVICSSGEISFLFSLPKTGYCVGEHIYVTADIRNMSNWEVIFSEMAINQTITFKAGGHTDTIQQRICSTKRGNIPPHQTYLWDNVPIFVPGICDVTTEHCNIMVLEYWASFTVGVKTKIRVKQIQVDIPIVIGVQAQ
ncbi:hypothetical protein ACHWQZ_G016126 [Mnemiopsis leidyi]